MAQPQTQNRDQPATQALLSDTALQTLSVVQLMQHIEANKAALRSSDMVGLYERWLGLTQGGSHGYIAHYNLGTLHHQARDLPRAEQAYRAALKSIDLPEARYNLGLLMEQGGRLHEAIEQWRRILDLSSPNALHMIALHGLIRVSRQLGWTDMLRRYLSQSLTLNADQPDLSMELQGMIDSPAANDQSPVSAGSVATAADQAVIFVVGVCFNEAAILPFFLDHYIHFVGASKVVLYDGGSTDGTAEIAARYPQVELIVDPKDKLDDRELMRIRNEEWKKHRDQCDWMVVCDVDELVYHPQLRQKLAEFKAQGVTLPMIEGFEMLSKTHPQHEPGHYIWERIQTGTANPLYYNKNLIFDPVIDINYTLGCHGCRPTGRVKPSVGFAFKNLHYRMLSHEHIVAKSRRAAARLSDWNKQTNAGFHYRHNAEMTRAKYNQMFVGASNVVNPRPRPAVQREVFETVLDHLLALDHEARLLELGSCTAFGRGGDSGSTELLAWFRHGFGGRFASLSLDARAARHVHRELSQRGLQSPLLCISDQIANLLEGLDRIDLVLCNAANYQGDEADLAAARKQALNEFLDVESRLSDEAVVVLDGVLDPAQWSGQFSHVAAYLLERRYEIRHSGYTTVFSKQPLRSNA